MNSSNRKHRIVIVGGGFAGLFSARYLTHYLKRAALNENVEVELISEINYFVFQPLLPEVAAGTINAQDAVSPLRQLLPHASIRQAKVLGINPDEKTITLIQGQKRKLQTVYYDELVIASGQETNLSLFPGFEHHSLTMKNLADAHRLRNHVIECMEIADVTRFDDIKRRALTFVVAGGGFSGVETLGELMEMIHRVRHLYPNIQAADIRAILIQRGSRLLPEMSAELGEYALKKLQQRGAEVWLNTGIKSASRYSVITSDGQRIPTHTVVTTIGNGPSAFVEHLPIQLQRGKIPVNQFLQVEGLNHIWSLGDVAQIPLSGKNGSEKNSRGKDGSGKDGSGTKHKPTFAPPTAQFARQESKTLARNLVASLQGKSLRHFDYQSKGSLASLGGYSGVAEIAGFRLTGVVAWILWRFIYIGLLPSVTARLRVALNWLFDYFMPRTIVCMAHSESPASRLLSYASGEIVHEVDEVLEGFYVVVAGKFERTIPGKNGEQDRVRFFQPGDSWGERCLEDQRLTIGRVKALEDGELLLLRANDLTLLRKGFAPFNQLLTNLHPQAEKNSEPV